MIRTALEYKVDLAPMCAQMNIPLNVLNEILSGYGKDCVITTGAEGKHRKTSLHAAGRALDIRSRDLAPLQQQQVKRAFNGALNEDFEILIEKDHFHIEYQPKCKF